MGDKQYLNYHCCSPALRWYLNHQPIGIVCIAGILLVVVNSLGSFRE